MLRGIDDPLWRRFLLRDIDWTVGDGETGIRLRGEGTLEVGGEVALVHRLRISLIHSIPGRPDEVVGFVSDPVPGEGPWPRVDADLKEVDPTPFRVLSLHVASLPIRELWFSTAHGFAAGLPDPAPVRRGAVEVLAQSGSVVLSGPTIAASLGLSSLEGLDLDALEVGAGGEPMVSFTKDVGSAPLGGIASGDLVGIPARRVRNYTGFSGVLGAQPPVADLGLDAVQRRPDGTWWFSIRQPVFSETLGELLGRGDVLSTTGKRIRSNADLLRAFGPKESAKDYGLDALFVWPSGEIWFSTEDSFVLKDGSIIGDGDLLSDRGEVVWRNRELLGRFSPLEDLADFGLDALVVVTDAVVSTGEPPRVAVRWTPSGLRLDWSGTGRFFQTEVASGLPDVFEPRGPIRWEHQVELPVDRPAGLFRIREW